MLELLALGQPYPREFHGDGPRVAFHPYGLEILFALAEPDAYEIGSFKSGRETKIGFAKWDRLGVLLVDFGEGFSFDVPFDAGIERPENVPALDITNDLARVPFTFIGVDPANGNRIFGMRYITASPRVSRLLVKTVNAQLAVPVDPRTYASRVAELYARFPTSKCLVKIALAYDKAGSDQAVHATPPDAANIDDNPPLARNAASPVKSFEHITLLTGHSRTSLPSEVGEAMEILLPWLDHAIKANSTPVPMIAFDGYFAVVTDAGDRLYVSVLRDSTPLILFGVSTHESAGPMWDEMTKRFPVMPDIKPPTGAMCAVALEPALAFSDAGMWLGDFERCVAWAWLTMRGFA
jgi:hypothetical protein